MPPLWWNDLGQWPPVIRYLPDAPVRIGLQGEDAADLARLAREVMTQTGPLDSKFPRGNDNASAESGAPGSVVARKPEQAPYPGAGARRWARDAGSRGRTICR